MQKLTPYVILADAGDRASGGTIGTISLGGYLVEIMNAVKYNVAVPGNHEFDFGLEQFMKLAASLDCGLTACNFRDLHTGELVLKPYKLIKFLNMAM